jgi:hypothetical protein
MGIDYHKMKKLKENAIKQEYTAILILEKIT